MEDHDISRSPRADHHRTLIRSAFGASANANAARNAALGEIKSLRASKNALKITLTCSNKFTRRKATG